MKPGMVSPPPFAQVRPTDDWWKHAVHDAVRGVAVGSVTSNMVNMSNASLASYTNAASVSAP